MYGVSSGAMVSPQEDRCLVPEPDVTMNATMVRPEGGKANLRRASGDPLAVAVRDGKGEKVADDRLVGLRANATMRFTDDGSEFGPSSGSERSKWIEGAEAKFENGVATFTNLSATRTTGGRMVRVELQAVGANGARILGPVVSNEFRIYSDRQARNQPKRRRHDGKLCLDDALEGIEGLGKATIRRLQHSLNVDSAAELAEAYLKDADGLRCTLRLKRAIWDKVATQCNELIPELLARKYPRHGSSQTPQFQPHPPTSQHSVPLDAPRGSGPAATNPLVNQLYSLYAATHNFSPNSELPQTSPFAPSPLVRPKANQPNSAPGPSSFNSAGLREHAGSSSYGLSAPSFNSNNATSAFHPVAQVKSISPFPFNLDSNQSAG